MERSGLGDTPAGENWDSGSKEDGCPVNGPSEPFLDPRQPLPWKLGPWHSPRGQGLCHVTDPSNEQCPRQVPSESRGAEAGP